MNNRLYKRALWDALGRLVPSASDLISLAGNIGALGATYLIASASLAGLGTGYIAAETLAHGKSDMDTARKSYENERLKADIGYLRGRIDEEATRAQTARAPKPARVIG